MQTEKAGTAGTDAAYARGMRSVLQGDWGERTARAFLIRSGWQVLERDARPCRNDRRLDIDLVAYDRRTDAIVFVEVKTHARHSDRAGRLWAVGREKKRKLLRACSCWIHANRWYGNFRFDVIEIYGEADAPVPPEIDHIENVPLFPPAWRFRK